jgi:hypothetical protein
MVDIAPAIFNRLTTDSGVTNLIGTRVYPSYDRQSDRIYPLVTYKFDITPQAAFDGTAGIEYAVGKFAAVATTYAGATQVADALYNSLEARSGTWAGVVVQGCYLQENGISDDVVTDPTTEEILYYVKVLQFDIQYST